MGKNCPYCESGKLSKHKTFDNEEKWNCDTCDRVFIEADETHVTDYNNTSKGDLVLKQ